MNQEHILSYESKMAVRSKMAVQNQFFWHNSESIQYFYNLLFAFFWCWEDANFVEKKVFQKIQDGGLSEKIRLSRHLGFFEKLLCGFSTPNECKKKIVKILDTLRVMSKNLILIRHFGSNRHF
jgi:hypothetical protein